MKKLVNLLFVAVACMLIATSGCSLPFISPDASPTAPVEPLAQPKEAVVTPEATPIPKELLPPALVQTDPVEGSIVAPDQQFRFSFNQPVVSESAETTIRVEPQGALIFDWEDAQTLSVSFSNPLPLDQAVSFTFAGGIIAENGMVSTVDTVINYQTAGPLLLTDRYPRSVEGFVDPNAALMVVFNQPVAMLGDATTPPAFTLSPAVEGTGEWLNTSTYVFTPAPALGGGIEYTITLNEGLSSQWGAPLQLSEEQSSEWSFRTAEPQLLQVEPGEEELIGIEPVFDLQFNQSMDVQSFLSSILLEDLQGNPVAIEISWNDNFSIFSVEPAATLSRDTGYRLRVAGSVASHGGTAVQEDVSLVYQTVGDLSVDSFTPSLSAPVEIYNGYASLQIHFNAHLANADFAQLVTFEPPLIDPTYFLSEENTLVVSGYFYGSRNYILRISEDLQDQWGGTSSGSAEYEFVTSPVQAQLAVPMLQYGEQILFTSPENISLAAQAVNISGVDIRTSPVSLDDFIRYATYQEPFIKELPEDDAEGWRQDFDISTGISEQVDIRLTQAVQLETGLYIYQLDAAEMEMNPQPFLLVVSNIHLTVKRSDEQLFVWVVDLQAGEPVDNMQLALYLAAGGEAASCSTDSEGRCVFSLPANLNPYQPLVVVHGEPGDEDFGIGTDRWSMGVSGWDFQIQTVLTQPAYFAYLYTDRAIYQPGQTVNFRVIVRDEDNARYALPDLDQVTVEVYGDFQAATGEVPLLDTIPVSLSDLGTGAGVFTLSEDAPPGYYSLRIPEVENSFLNFSVAEYHKPEIDLLVAFEDEERLKGAPLHARVQADYYFGAPAANVDIHWTLYTQQDRFELPFGYQTGRQDFYWLQEGSFPPGYQTLGVYVAEGDGRTDAEGAFSFEMDDAQLERTLSPEMLQRLNLEVTIKDESGFPVSARDSVRLHPEEYYIGIRPEQWSGTAGQPLGFAIQTSSWDLSSVTGVPLNAVLQKIRWVQSTDPASGFRRSSAEYIPVNGADLITNEQGQARIEMTPEEPGTYLLEVTGGNASTQVIIWVGGSGSASWPNLPNQQIPVTLDQPTYRAGDTATLLIPNPFDRSLALITVERDNIMRSYVIRVDQPALEFELPVEDLDAPNIYVGVTLLKAGDQENPDFRQGYVNIPVDRESLVLDVILTTNSESQEPGGEVILSLQVSDQQGNPVEGEFSLALIDKAVLALAEPNVEDIIDAFYGLQPLGVQTGLGLAAHPGRFPRPAADGIGGGGETDPAVRFVREDYRDTAYWNATLRTDGSGRVDVRVPLPDNLTTWVVMVRGITSDSRVGEAQTEVVVSKALLIRPVVPRFLVAADEVQFGAVLHNNTGESLPVDVTIQASGVNLSEGSAEIQRVIVEAGSSLRVNWWGTVQGVDQVELTFTAQSGLLSDSAVPETGAIPVLHYSVPQTFGTSGVLVDQGEILETVSFPLSYDIQGGMLTVEMAPSLASAILEEMQVMEAYPEDMTEAVVSRLLPNLEMLRAIQLFGLNAPDLAKMLTGEVREGLDHLSLAQNISGGWGWTSGEEEDAFITSYALLGLSQAVASGFFVEADVINSAQDYLLNALPAPSAKVEPWQLDRLVLRHYALYVSGITELDRSDLLELKESLNPWSRALLYLMLLGQDPDSQVQAAALNDLQALATQTATGTSWEAPYPAEQNFTSTVFNTAVVVYALANIDPASSLLAGGVRYLVSHRLPTGGWSNSFEAAWSLLALIEVMKATGELQSDFAFSAALNGKEMISGAAPGTDPVTAVLAVAPFEELMPDSPNALRIRKDPGEGRLYYRAYLQVDIAAEQAEPIQRGLVVERSYTLWSENCAPAACPEITQYSLGETNVPVVAHIVITVPEEMYYVVVEDWIPAGAEIIDSQLLTTQQGMDLPQDPLVPVHDTSSPGWGSGYFGRPQIWDDHIRWIARSLPAGTYELRYRFTPFLAGSYHSIPAQAYQYYFPEVQGASAGDMFTIVP